MSMCTDHALAFAEKLSLDEYGEPYHNLPLSIQQELLKRGSEMALNELKIHSECEQLLYGNSTDWDV